MSRLRRLRQVKSSRVHLALLAFWVLLSLPTVTIWKNSVLVVLLYSVYANVCTHWGAYDAAKGKELQEQSQADQND